MAQIKKGNYDRIPIAKNVLYLLYQYTTSTKQLFALGITYLNLVVMEVMYVLKK